MSSQMIAVNCLCADMRGGSMSNARLGEFVNAMRAQTPPLPDSDLDKIGEAVLVLLYRTLYQLGPCQAWKSFDWDALDRLHVKGLIGGPLYKRTSGALNP